MSAVSYTVDYTFFYKTMNDDEFIGLQLTFAEDGGHQILVDASFRLNKDTVVSRKLFIHPPKKKTFRALCILMLLAKYRGQSFADELGFIWFKDKFDRNTWIKTLGDSFGKKAQDKFFQDYFSKHDFLWATRGTGHAKENKKTGKGELPSAHYKLKRLPLENLRFCKAKRGTGGGKSTPIEGEELAVFAGQLEKYNAGKPSGWEPIVPEIIAETKMDRPLRLNPAIKLVISEPADEPKPFLVTTPWQTLNEHVRKAIKTRSLAGDWYVVSVVPNWLPNWMPVLGEAVTEHNARVKIVYQAPSAASNCSAIKAQLRINSAGVNSKDYDGVIKNIQSRIVALETEMAHWVRETRKSPSQNRRSKGSFEFFASYINHPFLAIMAVPPASQKKFPSASGAPPGTWCLVGLFPFYRKYYGKCCGVFLNSEGPVLNFYYHTILDLLKRGPKDGYLKKVDLLKTKPRRKDK